MEVCNLNADTAKAAMKPEDSLRSVYKRGQFFCVVYMIAFLWTAFISCIDTAHVSLYLQDRAGVSACPFDSRFLPSLVQFPRLCFVSMLSRCCNVRCGRTCRFPAADYLSLLFSVLMIILYYPHECYDHYD